jgi:hypothetical protein
MNTELKTEIRGIVARVREVQDARGLSDKQLLREFPQLGSTKTWRQRLVEEQFDDINVARLVGKLRQIATILDGGLPDEEFHSEMPFAFEMLTRLRKLENQTNDRRILVCLAPNGCGKSMFARWAVSQDRSHRCYLRMRPTWREKKLHICAGFVRALGGTVSTSNVAEVEGKAIEALQGEPRTVFIDQAHEGGVALMHELRAFVDETPSRFVYLAYPTAYHRVQTASNDALIEAQAFLGRCLKPPFDLYKKGIQQGDVEIFLQRVGGLPTTAAKSVAVEVLQTLRSHTNLRLLEDAIESATSKAGGKIPPVPMLVEEINALAGESAKATEKTEEEA